MNAAGYRRKTATLAARTKQFNQRVGDLLHNRGAHVPGDLWSATQLGTLLPWHRYAGLLGLLTPKAWPNVELYRCWKELSDETRAKSSIRVRQADSIPSSELQAATVAEFALLLHKLRKRAPGGVTALSRRSDISRSQIYSMTDVRTPRLPIRLDQVQRFAEACGLTDHQVQLVERLWGTINNKLVDEAALTGEHKLLKSLHGVMLRMSATDSGMDYLPGGHAKVAAQLVNQAVAQVATARLRDPEMIATVLEQAAAQLRSRAGEPRGNVRAFPRGA